MFVQLSTWWTYNCISPHIYSPEHANFHSRHTYGSGRIQSLALSLTRWCSIIHAFPTSSLSSDTTHSSAQTMVTSFSRQEIVQPTPSHVFKLNVSLIRADKQPKTPGRSNNVNQPFPPRKWVFHEVLPAYFSASYYYHRLYHSLFTVMIIVIFFSN